jgi:hypothetical protein
MLQNVTEAPPVKIFPLLALFLVLFLLLLLHIPTVVLLPSPLQINLLVPLKVPSPPSSTPISLSSEYDGGIKSVPLAPLKVHTSSSGVCIPFSPEGGGDLAIVIAGRSNSAQRHTAIYLTLALTLRTVGRHYPLAHVYLVDNSGGSDNSLAEFLHDRETALPPGARAPMLLNNSRGGYEMGAYAYATEVLGWASCFPFSHALFIQHTMGLAAPLPPLPSLPCFQPIFHFEDVYDSQEQVVWVRDALWALHLGKEGEDPPLCRGAAGTSFLLSAPCLKAWLAVGAFTTVAQRMGDSTTAYMATERLVPHIAQGLCGGCSGGGGGACSAESLQGTGICDGDGVEAFLRSEKLFPERYKGRIIVKTVGSGMCGSVNLREDLRRGGGEEDAWALLDAK